MAILMHTNGKIIAQDPKKDIRQLVMENKDALWRADLRGTDLHGLDLSGCDLRGAILDHASLLRADLRGADLAGACLDEATFHDARLDGADLTDALVYGTDFFTAGLRGAILTGVCMGHADFTSSDLTDAILPTSSILAQAHATAPDAGPDEDISLDWSAAGNDDYEALLDHIWGAWLCMDGIEEHAKDTGARKGIDTGQALTDVLAGASYVAPRYPAFTLSIPRDPSANPDNPDDDAPTGSVLVTVDGWDLAQAVADHTGYTTPEVVTTVADLRLDAEDILENCYGLTFRGTDGDIDTDGLDGFIRDMTVRRGDGLCWNAEYCDAAMLPDDAIIQAARDNGAVDITPDPEAPAAASNGPAAGPTTADPGMGI